jgi:hypothetical protein
MITLSPNPERCTLQRITELAHSHLLQNLRAGAKAKLHLLQIAKESPAHEPTCKGVLKQEAAARINDSHNVVQKWAVGAPEAKCHAQTCHSSMPLVSLHGPVLLV